VFQKAIMQKTALQKRPCARHHRRSGLQHSISHQSQPPMWYAQRQMTGTGACSQGGRSLCCSSSKTSNAGVQGSHHSFNRNGRKKVTADEWRGGCFTGSSPNHNGHLLLTRCSQTGSHLQHSCVISSVSKSESASPCAAETTLPGSEASSMDAPLPTQGASGTNLQVYSPNYRTCATQRHFMASSSGPLEAAAGVPQRSGTSRSGVAGYHQQTHGVAAISHSIRSSATPPPITPMLCNSSSQGSTSRRQLLSAGLALALSAWNPVQGAGAALVTSATPGDLTGD